MLVELAIRDIVLIERLDLQLGAGLTVLTGETGAGKSILLDAFALALGARGDGALVRHGATQGQVSALFEVSPDHPALAAAQALDIEATDSLLVRRTQFADGRTRAAINDQPVSAQALRTIGAALVEIHGQHADRALIDPAAHRSLVDAFGGLAASAQALAADHAEWRRLLALRDGERARVARARGEADYLRHAHEELTKLSPDTGEETALAERRTTLRGAEKVVGELAEARDATAGDHGPIGTLSAVLRRLERRAAQAPALVDPPLKALDVALDALEAVSATLDAALEAAAFDPRELERIEERLFALRAAARKYNVASDALAALAEKFAADLAALDAGETQLAALEIETEAAERRYVTAASDLSQRRVAAARKLDRAVTAELAPLKLERARFMTDVRVDAESRGPNGFDRVEFWVETNPGTRPGPLMKVASGGELARFLLALKVVLADRGSAPTLVFDEIDTGVGGAVAHAIGERLARLSSKVQVLAVTHAPQVAARAAGHFRILKQTEKSRVRTEVAPLDAPARREEIARMLAGASVTDEARAAAQRLLSAAE